ncbi:MAG: hypothetical protein IIZ78_10440 [Clostridiales bacterium]|nr:hypothetical protein [Clostridiales bacterium]
MSRNRRRNNPQDMTICEQLEQIKEEVCDDICKYRNSKDYRGLMSQESLEEICKYDCPLNKL